MESSLEREQVMPLLQEALQRRPEEREEFVRAACNGDQALHQQLVEALQWEERMGTFLLNPLIDFTHLARPFEPGQLVAERFEIVREIGEGGMGVVYEAFDRKLQQQVAIKGAKPGFQRLLSPELKAALKVRHHNICLVNEIHTAQTEYGEIDFLTMEFLEGETLSAHLVEQGKLKHEEALDIACQLCAGLAEAHHSGIIHRDLKSGNVILCRNEDRSRRAVITDFGLAGGLNLPSGATGGTPGYMAPELWQGGQAEKLSDIYALGVILHEMVTGRKPSAKRPARKNDVTEDLSSTWTPEGQCQNGEGADLPVHTTWTNEKLWWKREVSRPLPPSTWTKDLDPRWDRVIAGCLETSPAARTQDVSEVLARLRREPIRKTPFVVVALLIIAILAVVTLIPSLRQRVVEFIWPPNVRLAVLPFDGPKDLAAIGGGALQEVSDRVQLLPSERRWPLSKLSRSVAVIPPSRIASAHAETPLKAREVLHATHALKVSLQSEGDKLSAHAAVIDLSSQLPVKELSVQYPQSDAGAMPAALTHFVALAFNLRESSSEDKLSPAAEEPYLKGIYFLNRDTHSFDDAIVQFHEAARLDPSSALPAAGMALALVQKFNSAKENVYLEQAQAFMHTAQSRNPDSVRVLLASGRVNEANSQYLRALEDYRRVQQLEPRNVEALLGMANAYEHLREPEEAVVAYRKAQALDPEYYRPYHMLGYFYDRHGRYAEAVEQFQKMVARAPGLPDSYSALAAPLMQLGRYAEAEEAVQKSLQTRETAQGLNNLGVIRYFQGRYGEAADYQKRALKYDPNNYIWLLNVADNVRWAGHLAEARPYYVRGREQAKLQMTLNPQTEMARTYFAYASVWLNDKPRAEEEIRQAINLIPGDDEVLFYAVEIYELLGERDLAIGVLRGLNPEVAKELTHNPDLADFFQDPRVKQVMIEKGDQ
jgi:eukaryotic-like serine/threonine-protein kinase